MRQKLLLLAAVFFGVLAFVFTYTEINNEKNAIRGTVEERPLITIKRDLAEGEELKLGDITQTKQKIFRNDANADQFIPWDKHNIVVDKILAVSVRKDQPLRWSDFRQAARGKDGITGIIPSNNRAVSIAVDPVSSVTSLIQPNDHVDIIGTFQFPDMKADKSIDTLTLTILQNVTVLATGQEYIRQPAAIGSMKAQRRNYNTITLALSPKEAEMIVFASQKGKLTMSLRNYEETKIDNNLQSVNFKYLQEHIPQYNQERDNSKDRSSSR